MQIPARSKPPKRGRVLHRSVRARRWLGLRRPEHAGPERQRRSQGCGPGRRPVPQVLRVGRCRWLPQSRPYLQRGSWRRTRPGTGGGLSPGAGNRTDPTPLDKVLERSALFAELDRIYPRHWQKVEEADRRLPLGRGQGHAADAGQLSRRRRQEDRPRYVRNAQARLAPQTGFSILLLNPFGAE